MQNDPDSEITNVWQHLLEESQQNSASAGELAASYLIVLGDKRNGKSELLSKFRSQTCGTQPGYILDYSYISVKNKHIMDKDVVVSRMNVWQLDDPAHIDILNGLVPPSSLGSTAYVITVDLSRPYEIMDQLTKWLSALETLNEKLCSGLDASQLAKLKKKICKSVQTFADSTQKKVAVKPAEKETAPEPETAKDDGEGDEGDKADAEEKSVEGAHVDLSDIDASLNLAIPAKNLGVPLIVVGTKGDFFSRDPRIAKEANVDERFEFMVNQIRKAVLEHGGSFVLTSAAGEGTNVEALQDCIYNSVFKFPLKHPAKVVGSADDFSIVVPSGFDSLELINSGTKVDDSKTFASVFPEFKPEKSSEAAGKPYVHALSNEEFFRKLQAQLKGETYTAPEKKFTKFFKGLLNK